MKWGDDIRSSRASLVGQVLSLLPHFLFFIFLASFSLYPSLGLSCVFICGSMLISHSPAGCERYEARHLVCPINQHVLLSPASQNAQRPPYQPGRRCPVPGEGKASSRPREQWAAGWAAVAWRLTVSVPLVFVSSPNCGRFQTDFCSADKFCSSASPSAVRSYSPQHS